MYILITIKELTKFIIYFTYIPVHILSINKGQS